MKFWDSSAIVPIILPEPRSAQMEALFAEDGDVSVWWAARPECVSVVAGLLREARISSVQAPAARATVQRLFEDFDEVQPSETLRLRAERLLAVHPLRTADALQLAAALVWAQGQPAGLEFVSLDRRLREAAQKEGFSVLPAVLER